MSYIRSGSGGGNADNSNLAPIEATTTASRSYLVGDYLMLQGEFYKVISAISIGNALVVGTNIQATSVGDEVSDKQNEFIYWNQVTNTAELTLPTTWNELLVITHHSTDTGINQIYIHKEALLNNANNAFSTGFYTSASDSGKITWFVNKGTNKISLAQYNISGTNYITDIITKIYYR